MGDTAKNALQNQYYKYIQRTERSHFSWIKGKRDSNGLREDLSKELEIRKRAN